MRATVLASTLLLLLSCLSCGTSTKMSRVWSSGDYTGKHGQMVLVIDLTNDPGQQRLYENTFVTVLADNGVQAVAESFARPENEKLSKKEIQKLIKEYNIDLAIVTRLLSVEDRQKYVPPTTYYGYGPGFYPGWYGSMYPYYLNSYSIVTSPGYMVNYKVVNLETNVYDTANEKLIWNGVSQTFDPKNENAAIKSIAKTITHQLKKAGILK